MCSDVNKWKKKDVSKGGNPRILTPVSLMLKYKFNHTKIDMKNKPDPENTNISSSNLKTVFFFHLFLFPFIFLYQYYIMKIFLYMQATVMVGCESNREAGRVEAMDRAGQWRGLVSLPPRRPATPGRNVRDRQWLWVVD